MVTTITLLMKHIYKGFSLQPFDEDEEGYLSCNLMLSNKPVHTASTLLKQTVLSLLPALQNYT